MLQLKGMASIITTPLKRKMFNEVQHNGKDVKTVNKLCSEYWLFPEGIWAVVQVQGDGEKRDSAVTGVFLV